MSALNLFLIAPSSTLIPERFAEIESSWVEDPRSTVIGGAEAGAKTMVL